MNTAGRAVLLVAAMCVAGVGLSGCTEEQVRQFSEGMQQGMQQSNETMCAPGSTCFARLAPEVQKQRYCDMHPSYGCLQSLRGNSGNPSTEQGAVTHIYVNGVLHTCVGTGVSVDCT